MVKKKPSINQNFEALKAQMQAKRKLAENKFEKEKEEKSTPITTLTSSIDVQIDSTKIEEEEYITLNIVDDDEFTQIEESAAKDNLEKVDDVIELKPKSELSQQVKTATNDLEEPLEEIKQEFIEDDKDPIIKEEVVQSITPRSKKSETADINMNKIIIKRVEKQEAPKRITYYLKPETIKKIDKFSKATGMGKSEFVQTILDEILNNLEVEK